MKTMFASSIFAMVALISPVCVATDNVVLEIASEASSVNSDVSLQSQLPSTLIGDFDAKANPNGTRTLPGLFGGQGNQPIGLDMTAMIDGEIDSQPSGVYQLDLDFDALTIEISDLELDLLGDDAGALGLTVELAFETFRTFQPDSLYFGVPVAVPVGDGGLSVLTVIQSGPALPGMLSPTGPNQYDFMLAVPVSITIETELLGQPSDPLPFDTAILLNGVIEIDDDQITVTQSFEQFIENEVTDIQGREFSDLPLDLPTVLPPGETAHLLLSGSVNSVAFSLDLNATLVSEGQIQGDVLVGDLNGDGFVNLLDVPLFVDAILSGTFVPAADINQDGVVDLTDVDPFIDLLVG